MRDPDFAYGGGLVTERGLRRMTRWGCVLVALWTTILVIWGMLVPEPYARGYWLVFDNFFIGRAVCMYEGVRMNFGRIYLLIQGGGQDIGMTLITFPWIVRFYHRVSQGRLVDRILGSVTQAAERNQQRLRGFGAVGLYLFVFFPLAGTGTLVGSVVGYLLGMRMGLVLPVVIAGHLSSLIFLLTFFDWLEPMLRSANEGLAQYFAWIALAVVVVAGWLFRTVKNRLFPATGANASPQPLPDAEANADAVE